MMVAPLGRVKDHATKCHICGARCSLAERAAARAFPRQGRPAQDRGIKFLPSDSLSDESLPCTDSANFSDSSFAENDEDMLLHAGDTRFPGMGQQRAKPYTDKTLSRSTPRQSISYSVSATGGRA
jgi:hypothetical protein